MKLRIKKNRWAGIVLCLLIPLFPAETYSQKPQGKLLEPQVSKLPDISPKRSREEQLIRFAYKKLQLYNVVARFGEGKGLTTPERPGKGLRFELSDFETGDIEELKGTLFTEVVSDTTGEIIRLIRSGVTLDGAPEQLRYYARWEPGNFSTMSDRNSTIGDLLKIEAGTYFDVKKYTRYKVRVSLDGKTRSYSAVMVYHGPLENLKIEFWDTVVGLGGTITRVWEEHQQPDGLVFRNQPKNNELTFQGRVKKAFEFGVVGEDEIEPVQCEAGAVRIQQCRIAADLLRFWGIEDSNYWSPDFIQPAPSQPDNSQLQDISWHVSDETGHHPGTGAHWAFAAFRPECIPVDSSTQRCVVRILTPQFDDDSAGHNDGRYHVGSMEQTSRGQSGPRGQNIQCDAAVGVAFSRCFFRNCTVPIELAIIGSGMGAVAQVLGGDLWKAANAEGNICNIPTTTAGSPGGCGQSAEYGCLPGFAQVGGICTRSPIFITQCDRLGGYDPDACGCFGACYPDGSCSPIVVDVLGNGFDMTSASTGVFFDMGGQGRPERYSWTAANSDDAWLALDRNNNGSIDSGRELFGNVTTQDIHPDGVERNGFLALALYDSVAYGGNGDGVITSADAIFSRLKLWRDDNHNGVSESCELFALPDLGLEKIDLDYRSSKRVDEHGNEFRYRSKVHRSNDSNIGRWAWDVFLVKQP